jgi:hypothetical protein
MSDELKVINEKTPYEPCRHLLSKGMFINAENVGDGHVWCQKTQEALGPDRELVERVACIPGRSCYETIL